MRQPAGVILAGGGGRRMGGVAKALLPLAGRPLAAHVADRLGPQVAALALNAQGAEHAALGLPLLPDPATSAGRAGPLAGLLAAMIWAAGRGDPWVVTAACDTPFLPPDLVPRLILASGEGARPAIAEAGGRLHPVIGLWSVALAGQLQAELAAGRARVGAWAEAAGATPAVFSDARAFDNLNTPEDLAEAEALLRARAP